KLVTEQSIIIAFLEGDKLNFSPIFFTNPGPTKSTAAVLFEIGAEIIAVTNMITSSAALADLVNLSITKARILSIAPEAIIIWVTAKMIITNTKGFTILLIPSSTIPELAPLSVGI